MIVNYRNDDHLFEDDDGLEIVGAVKLMDGLFIGDAICAEVI
jgi:hypothetical protein